MRDREKTKGRLIHEMKALRTRIATLESSAKKRAIEEQYKVIVQTIPDILYMLDPCGKFIFVSESMRQLGYTPRGLIGKYFAEILHPDDINGVSRRKVLPKCKGTISGPVYSPKLFDERRTGKRITKNLVVRILRKSPRSTPRDYCYTELHSYGNWAKNSKGAETDFLGSIGIIRDITERKRIEDAVRTSENRYRRLFEMAQDGILLLDRDTAHILDANPFITKMLGYPHDEFLGKRLWEIGIFKDAKTAKAVFLKLKTNKYVRYENLPLETKYGRRINTDFISNVYGISNKNIIQCDIRDVTERKKAEDELLRYREKLENMVEKRTRSLQQAQEQIMRQERLALLGRLAGGVGHELRTPLGAMANAVYYLNMLLKEPEAGVKEMLGILKKEVATAEKIISSLLYFCRPKAPVWKEANVNDVIGDALNRIAVPGNIDVVRQSDEALPLITTDPDQLAQVFGNIILNAIQAMPEGGRLTITSHKPSPMWLTISLADTGVGISRENMGKIFEPFFTTKAKGIGFGLVISRAVVENQGGTIEVRSKVGKGSSFIVKLPIRSGPSSKSTFSNGMEPRGGKKA